MGQGHCFSCTPALPIPRRTDGHPAWPGTPEGTGPAGERALTASCPSRSSRSPLILNRWLLNPMYRNRSCQIRRWWGRCLNCPAARWGSRGDDPGCRCHRCCRCCPHHRPHLADLVRLGPQACQARQAHRRDLQDPVWARRRGARTHSPHRGRKRPGRGSTQGPARQWRFSWGFPGGWMGAGATPPRTWRQPSKGPATMRPSLGATATRVCSLSNTPGYRHTHAKRSVGLPPAAVPIQGRKPPLGVKPSSHAPMARSRRPASTLEVWPPPSPKWPTPPQRPGNASQNITRQDQLILIG
jgi:hypothetical protein